MNAFARAQLLAVAEDLVGHARENTTPLADRVMEIDADHYTDPERFERELRLIFRRLPLMLAAGCELPSPGDYKSMGIAGVPVLLVRGRDGAARAFLNVCTHRGAIIAEGCGNASRFVCPYHGWAFDNQGSLVGIASRRDFGDVDATEKGLRSFPVLEEAGLIWAVLDPDSQIDIEGYLGKFGEMLKAFGFEKWHFLQQRTLVGANWKLAFDAHLEFYHLPVLHRNTFGPKISPKAFYYHWGPHQRLTRPHTPEHRTLPEHANLFAMTDRPSAEWTDEAMMLGEWIIYPNISINSFYEGGRGVIVSQIFPGATVRESYTVQTYLMERAPEDDASRNAAKQLCDFLGQVVNDEDLPTSIRQQRALESGLLPRVCFGRNEGGLQQFHRWTSRILETQDEDLDQLFDAASPD